MLIKGSLSRFFPAPQAPIRPETIKLCLIWPNNSFPVIDRPIGIFSGEIQPSIDMSCTQPRLFCFGTPFIPTSLKIFRTVSALRSTPRLSRSFLRTSSAVDDCPDVISRTIKRCNWGVTTRGRPPLDTVASELLVFLIFHTVEWLTSTLLEISREDRLWLIKAKMSARFRSETGFMTKKWCKG